MVNPEKYEIIEMVMTWWFSREGGRGRLDMKVLPRSDEGPILTYR